MIRKIVLSVLLLLCLVAGWIWWVWSRAQCSSSTCFGINWNTATVAEVKNIDVNVMDMGFYSPLHWAARENENPAVITALLEAGAEADAGDPKSGTTPLHLAVRSNENPAVIVTLLKAGAKVNRRDIYGDTPLHGAVKFNKNPAVVTTLLNAGAEVDARDEDGDTPLHSAVKFNKNPTVIAALLKAGAEARAKNSAGQTPFDLIQKNKSLKHTDAYRRLHNAQYK